MSFLLSALAVLVAFGVVIFVHEFGHFIVAKKSGVKVDRFSFGLGPEMIGFQWGETRYCIAWIPLGGEVRMAGEMELEDVAAAPAPRDPREFFALSWYRRIPIVVAGPAMNYLLSFLLFVAVALVWGSPALSTEAVIGDLADNFPAAKAGLKPGDRFLSVNGAPVSDWNSLAETIHSSPGKAVDLAVRRGAEDLKVNVTPVADKVSGRGLIGITPATVYERMGVGAAVKRGLLQTWGYTRLTLHYLWEKISRREKPDLSGPVGIASVVAKAAKSGMADYVLLIALISVGVGLFNLFPIPLLDGGHLFFYLWEGLFRRKPGKRMVQTANSLGLAFLLSIFLFATYSDIQRLRGSDEKPPVSGETPK
jgi:regulator of sigma E protease